MVPQTTTKQGIFSRGRPKLVWFPNVGAEAGMVRRGSPGQKTLDRQIRPSLESSRDHSLDSYVKGKVSALIQLRAKSENVCQHMSRVPWKLWRAYSKHNI
eukprot:4762452-Amphidinium_carterae.1